MKKDLTSYQKHDSEFNADINGLDQTLDILKKYDEVDQFKILGFEYAIKMSNPTPDTHIDVGSGNGWLVKKTSSQFKKVIGIEPSSKGVELARKITEGQKNITFINKDMVDGLNELSPRDPVFITTATVLSHIEDFYVTEFLKIVNELPINSYLCFDERYDKNIQWKMWHIRSKEWWEERLPNWQLYFLNLENNGYPSGIFGMCIGKSNVIPTHRMSKTETLIWSASRIKHLTLRALKKILKYFYIKHEK